MQPLHLRPVNRWKSSKWTWKCVDTLKNINRTNFLRARPSNGGGYRLPRAHCLASELAITESQLFEIMARRGRLESERDESGVITFETESPTR